MVSGGLLVWSGFPDGGEQPDVSGLQPSDSWSTVSRRWRSNGNGNGEGDDKGNGNGKATTRQGQGKDKGKVNGNGNDNSRFPSGMTTKR